MKDKIEQAKQQLGLSNAQLSVKLGYSSGYISRRLKNAPAPKTQELIKHRINELLGESELSAVKKELEHKNQVLDKRNDLYADAEYRINALENELDLVKTLNQQTINDLHAALDEKIDSIYELGDRIIALENQMMNERVVFVLFAAVVFIAGLLSVVIS